MDETELEGTDTIDNVKAMTQELDSLAGGICEQHRMPAIHQSCNGGFAKQILVVP